MTSLRRLLPYIGRHSRSMMLASVCMVFSGILASAFLVMAEKVLKPMLNPGQHDRLAQLNYFAVAVLVISILRAITDFGQGYISQRTGQRVLNQIRADLFDHLQELSIGFFESRRTGEIMSRLTNDLLALQSIMTLAVATAVSAPIELIFCVGFMIYKNWKLSCFVLVILPPVAFLIGLGGRKIKRATTQLQIQLASLNDYLQEKIAAMRLIQTFGTQPYERRLFNEVNEEAYRRTMRPIRIQSGLAPIIELTGMVGVLLSLWFGGRQVIGGTLGAESLLVFLYAMHRTAMRTKSLAGLNLMFKQADAAATRLFEVLDMQPEVRDAPDAINLSQRTVRGHLKFENVRFAYGDNADVLHDITFEIKPGEVVALAGLSGSGKSTIAALVPRLYDPTSGRVCIDEYDLRDVSRQSLRALIGAVPQETTLFHGTIRDNIAYGRPEASLDEIVEAARRANADQFIRQLPEGYASPLGERGVGLSGGQKQRIAIARALLRDPRLLILDEATSSLDAESEALVQEALTVLMEGRTTLIIAHRLSTIQRADRILVLDQGRIVETGNHDELLARRGRYHSLYQMQVFAARQEPDAAAAPATSTVDTITPAA